MVTLTNGLPSFISRGTVMVSLGFRQGSLRLVQLQEVSSGNRRLLETPKERANQTIRRGASGCGFVDRSAGTSTGRHRDVLQLHPAHTQRFLICAFPGHHCRYPVMFTRTLLVNGRQAVRFRHGIRPEDIGIQSRVYRKTARSNWHWTPTSTVGNIVSRGSSEAGRQAAAHRREF